MANPEVKNFQKKLDKDEDAKKAFIISENSDSDLDISSDEETKISKSKCKETISNKLFHRLVEQQDAISKIQKLVYKLKAELSTEEVQARYVKLDLNNAQVKIEELESKLKDTEDKLYMAKTENYVMRAVAVLYLLWIISKLSGPSALFAFLVYYFST
jgi:hypothetical protein